MQVYSMTHTRQNNLERGTIWRLTNGRDDVMDSASQLPTAVAVGGSEKV